MRPDRDVVFRFRDIARATRVRTVHGWHGPLRWMPHRIYLAGRR